MGDYLTAWERRRGLERELSFWRKLIVAATTIMLILFVVGRSIAGGVVSVIDVACLAEAVHVRRHLERLPQ